MTRPRHAAAIALLAVLLGTGGAAIALEPPAAEAPEEKAEAVEFESQLLGRFLVRDLRASEGSKLRISFALYAEFDPANATATRAFADQHEHRIRNAVLVAVRTCDQKDFLEPELDRFRHRIRARLRRVLPELEVERLLVGEFEFLTE